MQRKRRVLNLTKCHASRHLTTHVGLWVLVFVPYPKNSLQMLWALSIHSTQKCQNPILSLRYLQVNH